MTSTSQAIRDNLARVREQMATATTAANRPPDSVTLVAVCKYVGAEETHSLVEAGCRDLGESRPQQLWEKAAEIGQAGVRWHLVGHLQRNKVRRTLPLTALIHSVDSERLLRALDDAARDLHLRPRLLLEVNCSGDVQKHGLTFEEARRLHDRLCDFEHVDVAGLMTMAPREGGRAAARTAFARLRELRDQLRASRGEGAALGELSMGMSGDFPEAIAEGATIIRVGSTLFQGLP